MRTALTSGYGAWTDRESGKTRRETDTVKCRHCGGMILVKPGTVNTVYLIPHKGHIVDENSYLEEAGAFCRNCMGPICLTCHHDGRCTPFMRVIELQEEKQRLIDSIVGLRL